MFVSILLIVAAIVLAITVFSLLRRSKVKHDKPPRDFGHSWMDDIPERYRAR